MFLGLLNVIFKEYDTLTFHILHKIVKNFFLHIDVCQKQIIVCVSDIFVLFYLQIFFSLKALLYIIKILSIEICQTAAYRSIFKICLWKYEKHYLHNKNNYKL